jgi:FkbM family methyltransferase
MLNAVTLINSILQNFGLSITRNSSRADLPSLIRRLQSYGIELNVVYDIGAYKGLWSKALAAKLSKNVKFFLFEPNEEHNTSLNAAGFPYFNVLLSNSSEVRPFYGSSTSGDSYYPEVSPSGAAPMVRILPSVTLDSLVFGSKQNLPIPDLVKIDTQGSELDILEGAREVLMHCSVVILECPIVKYNQGAPDIQKYLDFMFQKNFVPVAVVEIHVLREVFVQIDIAFLSKKVFNEKFGDLDDMGFWKSTNAYYSGL